MGASHDKFNGSPNNGSSVVYPNDGELSSFTIARLQLLLAGSHLTPCGTDLQWPIGSQFTPVDAVVMGAKAVQQMDIQRLSDRVVGWLDATCKQPSAPSTS